MRPYNRRKEQKILRDIRDRFNNHPSTPRINYDEKKGNRIYEGRSLVYECDDIGIFRIYSAKGRLVYERRQREK